MKMKDGRGGLVGLVYGVDDDGRGGVASFQEGVGWVCTVLSLAVEGN